MKPHKIFWIGLFLIILYGLKFTFRPLSLFLTVEAIFLIIGIVVMGNIENKEDEKSIFNNIIIYNSILLCAIGVLTTSIAWVFRRKFWKKINFNKFNKYIDETFQKRYKGKN